VGTLALAFQAADQAQARFKLFFQQAGYLYGQTLYLTRLFAYLDLSPGAVEGALKRAASTHPVPSSIQQGFEFRNVSFRYPGSEADVLKNVSFSLRPGETIALVGENGAGKTTLVKLLARLYDPTEGTILLDGRDLCEYDLDSYQKQLGVIFQDYIHYHLTARENIGFGQTDAMDDGARILKAAELGGASSLVQYLPQGLDTMLGKTFEGGVDLSGGEWQKLALSRAFMRDGQLLILDEPTAALDPLAEYEVYRRFADLVAGKMVVLVSHHFSTVRMADRILVLRQGSLIEEGTHEELLAMNGRYAEMFNVQAQKYQ
jgi:ATP-binding cassette subfamily B protein